MGTPSQDGLQRHSGSGSERQDERCAPREAKADLLETLAAFLRLGDRRTTAEQLHVHPNTVDYRLRRVHTLTGLEPTSTSDVTLLGASLVARII